MAKYRFEEPVENIGALGCALADSAEDKIMLDIVGVKKAETEMGLVLLGMGQQKYASLKSTLKQW